jgi:hypothetical protein
MPFLDISPAILVAEFLEEKDSVSASDVARVPPRKSP